MKHRLYRSTTDKMIGGVCGGLGEYLDIDPVLVRIITVILFFVSGGAAIIAYLVGWIIIPKKPSDETGTISSPIPSSEPKEKDPSWKKYLPGLILIGIGLLLLIRENWFWFDWQDFWPILLILIGLLIVFRKDNNNTEKEHAATQAPNSPEHSQNGGTLA